MRTFQQILEAAGYETDTHVGPEAGSVECLSVGLPGNGRLGHLFAGVIDAMGPGENDIVSSALRRMRTDPLGCGIAVYFPGIPRS